MKTNSLLLPPVIILFLNTLPTDDTNNGLDMLRQNPWFRRAIKIGCVLDVDFTDVEELKRFTGNPEFVCSFFDEGVRKTILTRMFYESDPLADEFETDDID